MMDNAIRVIEDEGDFIAFCRDDIPIGDALCVDEYQMAEQYTKIERELEAARAEIERLLKESQDEMDFSFKILDSCSNQRDALKADLAAAVDVIKTIANHEPYIDSEFGGGECFYCGGAWSNYTGEFKHTEECTYEKARAFLKRMR